MSITRNFFNYNISTLTTIVIQDYGYLILFQFTCCGVDSVENNNQEFMDTNWWTSGDNGNDLVPFSCCRNATEDNYKTMMDQSCQQGTLSNANSKVVTNIVVEN